MNEPDELKFTGYWIGRAAMFGDPEACSLVSLSSYSFKYQSEDSRVSFKWMHRAADLKCSHAKYVIGLCREIGCGCDISPKIAVANFFDAAVAGNVSAQYKLANCYSRRYGVAKDDRKALCWYKKAAGQDHSLAILALEWRFEDINGPSQAVNHHAAHYQSAAIEGDITAQNNLAGCHKLGLGVPPNFEASFRWCYRAAQLGLINAQYNLGICLHFGLGVSPDYSQSFYWFAKAAGQGDVESQCCVGWCYHYGYGVKRDLEHAMRWYRQAADQGSSSAQYSLGVCLEKLQAGSSLNEAMEWYRLAAANGEIAAQAALLRFGSNSFNHQH
jgi:hypothetical protein